MRRILVLYQSRTGFTERYARWLGEALDASCLPLKDYRAELAGEYDIFLCGGAVIADEIDGMGQYRRIRKQNPEKTFFYFATGLRPASGEVREQLRQANLRGDDRAELYYFQGGLSWERLEPKQKALLTALRAMLRRRRNLSAQEEELLGLLAGSSDYCDRGQIEPLLARLAEFAPQNDEIGR